MNVDLKKYFKFEVDEDTLQTLVKLKKRFQISFDCFFAFRKKI